MLDEGDARAVFRNHPELPSNARRLFPPTESWDLYRFQAIRRVPLGDRIWTRAYLAGLVRDGVLLLAMIALNIVAVLAVSGLLVSVDEGLWFVSGGTVLVVVFGLALRTVMGADDLYATRDQAHGSRPAFNDVTCNEHEYVADLTARLEKRRERGNELVERRQRLVNRLTGRRSAAVLSLERGNDQDTAA